MSTADRRRTTRGPRRAGVVPPRRREPDLGPEDAEHGAEELTTVPRDGFDRIARIHAVGGSELPDLSHAELVDVRITDAYAASWEAPHLHLEACELTRLRVGAAQMPDARWTSVRVEGGRWGYLDLRGAVLEDCELIDVDLDDLDLTGARVERVRIRGGRIATLHLGEARCTDLDLRGGTVDQVTGWDGARGIVVDPALVVSWADDLARHIGLRVES